MLLVFRTHSVTPSNKILLWVAIVGEKTVIDHYVRVPNAKLVYTQFSGNLHLFEVKLCLPVWRVWSDSGMSIIGFKLSAPVHQLDFVIAWSQEQLDFYEYTLAILMLLELEHIPHWLYVVECIPSGGEA